MKSNRVLPTEWKHMDLFKLKKSIKFFRALIHPLREEIIKQIDAKPGINVTELYIILRMEQSICSQQLAILRRAGLVSTKKVATNVFYFINYEYLDHKIQLINQFGKE